MEFSFFTLLRVDEQSGWNEDWIFFVNHWIQEYTNMTSFLLETAISLGCECKINVKYVVYVNLRAGIGHPV